MALTVKQLIHSLEDKTTIRYLGPSDAEIYSIKLWTEDEPDSPDILYVAAYDRTEALQSNVLLTGESQIESVISNIQKMIVRDYQAGSALVRLTQAVMEKK